MTYALNLLPLCGSPTEHLTSKAFRRERSPHYRAASLGAEPPCTVVALDCSTSMSQTYSTTVSDAERGATLGATLLRVAWFAIILGLVIEAVLLVLVAGFGDIPGIKEIAVDLVQKISW